MAGDDYRIQIGGQANVSGSQIASGKEVSQTQNIGGGPVEQAFTRVAELLEQHAAEIPEVERARRDLADVQGEAAESDPDRDRMTHALERLGARVAGVAVLTQAVHELATQLGLA